LRSTPNVKRREQSDCHRGESPATPAARGIDAYNAEADFSREAIPYEVTLRECKASRVELTGLNPIDHGPKVGMKVFVG